MNAQNSISFIICGLEHSGTTLASDLFRQVDKCDSGFECGALLCNSPRLFPTKQPFFDNMIAGWRVSDRDLIHACDTENFDIFYKRLYNSSSLFKQSMPNIWFDKTPRYIVDLERICNCLDVPIITMIKDPRSIFWSDFKRTKLPPERIVAWYEEWMPKKKAYMHRAYKGYLFARSDPRCLVVRLEDLCLSARATMHKMFSHASIEPKPEYLYLRNKRYEHTRGSSITISTAVEPMVRLSQEIQLRVCQDFKDMDFWFYPEWQSHGSN